MYGQTVVPADFENLPEDNEEDEDTDIVLDELAYAFPEHFGELPQAHVAPWGIFDKARQVSCPWCLRQTAFSKSQSRPMFHSQHDERC